MEAIHPRVRVVRKRCARKTHPCPQCGKLGRRKDTHTRRIRDIAFGEIAIIELTVGEYRADCSCCKTFRSQVNGVGVRHGLQLGAWVWYACVRSSLIQQ